MLHIQCTCTCVHRFLICLLALKKAFFPGVHVFSGNEKTLFIALSLSLSLSLCVYLLSLTQCYNIHARSTSFMTLWLEHLANSDVFMTRQPHIWTHLSHTHRSFKLDYQTISVYSHVIIYYLLYCGLSHLSTCI